MGIVRLGPNGEVEVIVPCTPEEAARADAKLLELARAIARMMAEEDWRRHQAECQAARRTPPEDPSN